MSQHRYKNSEPFAISIISKRINSPLLQQVVFSKGGSMIISAGVYTVNWLECYNTIVMLNSLSEISKYSPCSIISQHCTVGVRDHFPWKSRVFYPAKPKSYYLMTWWRDKPHQQPWCRTNAIMLNIKCYHPTPYEQLSFRPDSNQSRDMRTCS